MIRLRVAETLVRVDVEIDDTDILVVKSEVLLRVDTSRVETEILDI